MSRQTDRDRLVAQLARELPDLSYFQVADLSRQLMRAGATLQRLAEAQCNGDWPADHGSDWKTLPCGGAEDAGCGSCWHPSALKGKARLCPDCRTQARVTALLAPYGMTPIFNGDPRGAVFLVIPPSYAERNAGKNRFNLEGIYVS